VMCDLLELGRGGTSGWFMIYMGDEIEDRFVMAHDKTNGRRELQDSMRCDELKLSKESFARALC
jgi:hypothetical protein